MKRTTRKLLITVCMALLLVCTLGLGLVACKRQRLVVNFKQSPYTYQRGDIVDAYDLIEREEGVSYSFAFSYLTLSDDGNSQVSSTVEEIEGNTYFLVEASRYTMKVVATKGEMTAEGETQFDVVGTDPILLPPAVSLVRSIGSRALVDTLLSYAAPTVIPLSSELSVDYYTYQESQAPTLLDTANTNPKIKIETSVDEWITFDKLGLYEFHVIAKNGEGEADAFFKVKVLPDLSALVDEEKIENYKNVEFAQNSDGTTDFSTMRLVGSPDLSQASYAVLEDEFTDGQVARFEFYGKNMPSYIGLYNTDTNENEPNSLTKGRGFVFTVERASVEGHTRLYGPQRLSSDTVMQIDSNETNPLEHFGFSELEDGVHYFFEIAMKTTGTTATRKESKPYGAPWLVGKETQNMALYFSLYSVNEGNAKEPYTLVAHSQTKFERDNPALGLYEVGEEIKGKLVAYSSISRDVTFKYHKDTLLNTEFDKTQISFNEQTKTLEWEAVDGAENYVVNMGESTSSRIAVLDKDTCLIDLSETYERLETNNVYTFNVYASVGNNTFSDKKYSYRFVKGDVGVVGGELTEYDTTAKTATVLLAGRHAASASHFQTDVGYLAFGDTYTLNENGTYVDVYFTGNNMPQVEFFATDILSNIRNKDGETANGFIVTNGHAHQSAYSETPTGGVGGYSAYDLFYEYGVTNYNRLTNGSAGYLGGARISQKDGTYTYTKKDNTSASVEYSNFSMYSLMKVQSETQAYRYTVGMFKDSQGGIWIDAKLYKVNGNEETLFASWRSKVKFGTEQENLGGDQTLSGKIVLHAAYKGNEKNAGEHFYNRFTCNQPYQGNATAYPLVDGGTLNENTSTVKLNGGNVNGSSSVTKNSGYIAFQNTNAADGKFILSENGTYVDFYFTGNNMPNVEFFGSSISGDMFNDETNTGYVVSNGSGRTALYTKYAERYAHMADAAWLTTNTTDGGSYPYGGFALYPHYFSYGISGYNKFTQTSELSTSYLQYHTSESDAYTYDVSYAKYSKAQKAWNVGTIRASKFSMFELMKDETRSWHYVVGMYKTADNKVYLDAKLYEISSDSETLYASYNAEVETLDTGVERSGYIIVHAALKGSEENHYYTNFSYVAPYAGSTSTQV